MPTDLTVSAISAPASTTTQRPQAAVAPAPPPSPTTTAPAFANPSLQLDPSLGIVVIKFHNASGAVTSSIPSDRQLAAYQRHGGVPPPPDSNAAPRDSNTATATETSALPSVAAPAIATSQTAPLPDTGSPGGSPPSVRAPPAAPPSPDTTTAVDQGKTA